MHVKRNNSSLLYCA